MVTNQKGIDYMLNCNTEKEIWKDIVGYENEYQVSNFGRVRSKDRYVPHKNGSKRVVPGKMRKHVSEKDGYHIIMLNKNKKRLDYYVHRLVALAQDTNPDNKPQVNHIDEVKNNNHYKSLEWVTRKENNNHGTRIDRIQKEKAKRGRAVTVVDTKLNVTHTFVSISQVCRETGLSRYSVEKNLNNGKLIKGRFIIERRG